MLSDAVREEVLESLRSDAECKPSGEQRHGWQSITSMGVWCEAFPGTAARPDSVQAAVHRTRQSGRHPYVASLRRLP
jgi:hypothetical protein